jgi:hypothetical protein
MLIALTVLAAAPLAADLAPPAARTAPAPN